MHLHPAFNLWFKRASNESKSDVRSKDKVWYASLRKGILHICRPHFRFNLQTYSLWPQTSAPYLQIDRRYCCEHRPLHKVLISGGLRRPDVPRVGICQAGIHHGEGRQCKDSYCIVWMHKLLNRLSWRDQSKFAGSTHEKLNAFWLAGLAWVRKSFQRTV